MLVIANAYAADSPGFSLDSMGSFIPIALMFVILYFLMIRPQQKKQKEQKNMLNALSVGDEVLTAGGIVGKIVNTSENFLLLEVSQGTQISMQKTSVISLLPKGTLNTLWLPAGQTEEQTPTSPEVPTQTQ